MSFISFIWFMGRGSLTPMNVVAKGTGLNRPSKKNKPKTVNVGGVTFLPLAWIELTHIRIDFEEVGDVGVIRKRGRQADNPNHSLGALDKSQGPGNLYNSKR